MVAVAIATAVAGVIVPGVVVVAGVTVVVPVEVLMVLLADVVVVGERAPGLAADCLLDVDVGIGVDVGPVVGDVVAAGRAAGAGAWSTVSDMVVVSCLSRIRWLVVGCAL